MKKPFTHFDVKNLLVPAFGDTECLVMTFNPTNGYTIQFNQVTIDELPFRPQSVTVDATDVPDTETVTFTVNTINFNRIIKGGNTETFNYPCVTNQDITITVSDGSSEVRGFFYNFPAFVDRTGVLEVVQSSSTAQDVTVTNVNGAYTQTDFEVTNVDQELLAANANRRYFLLQNNDAAGIVYVNFSGVAATAANGFKIMPGGTIELSQFAPTGAIHIIGDIASNPNVVIAEA